MLIQGVLNQATVGHGEVGEDPNAHGLNAPGFQVSHLLQAAGQQRVPLAGRIAVPPPARCLFVLSRGEGEDQLISSLWGKRGRDTNT